MRNRRQFLGSTVASTSALTWSALSYGRTMGSNERVGMGYLGFGLIGKRHVLDFQAQKDVLGLAISDAHRGRVDEAKALIGGEVKGYSDFRQLLDNRDVNAVVVSTPDHWHALMTMMACDAGKDVYVEKPLSLFIREGRWMIDVAQRTKRVVQVGTQQRSGPHYQTAKRLIQEGAIGQIHSVRMGSSRNIMPGFGAPADCDPPADLDWGMFLGPAPKRPYNPNRGIYHFRWFWDYSGGQMTNLGHHQFDIVHWCLGGQPTSVSSIGGRFVLQDNGETPDTQDAIFAMKTANGSSYSATWHHREASAGVNPEPVLTFYGTKGSLAINRKGFTITPDKKVPPANRVPQFAGAHPVGGPQRIAETGPDEFWANPVQNSSGNEYDQFTRHARDFLDKIKTRQTPNSDLESSHKVSTFCHLANLSLRLGRPLVWDSVNETIVGDVQANSMLVRPYRAPWDVQLRSLIKSSS